MIERALVVILRVRRALRAAMDRFWSLGEFLADEWTSRQALGGRLRPRLVVRGFHSVSHQIYGLDRHAIDLYVSDLQRLRSGRIDEAASVLLCDKLLFERVFSPWLPVPASVALTRCPTALLGSIRSVSETIGLHRPLTLAECLSVCPDGVVCKPVGGAFGRGIVVIRPHGTDECSWNGTPMSLQAANDRLARTEGMLIVAFVQQARATALFNPRTTNTLRVLTMVDPGTGQAFVARAVQRIGVRASEPVDNWSQGGLCALVDTQTGQLGPAVTKPTRGLLEWHVRHPETGTAIEGTVVPNWATICGGLLRAAEMFPMLPYVGWDVIPTDVGYAVIEGNFRSDVNLLQVHGGLLADERVHAFYRHHRIV